MTLTKNQQLLAYIAKGHQRATVTSLLKLAYIIDLISIEQENAKISDFTYRRYYYGPFDQAIYSNIENLVKENILVPKLEFTGCDEYTVYTFNCDTDVSFENLSEKERGIIDATLEKLKGYGAKTLTEIAYKTEPMKKLNAHLGGTEGLNAVLI